MIFEDRNSGRELACLVWWNNRRTIASRWTFELQSQGEIALQYPAQQANEVALGARNLSDVLRRLGQKQMTRSAQELELRAGRTSASRSRTGRSHSLEN